MATDERYRKGSLFSFVSADRPNAVLGPNRAGPASAYRHGYFEAARALVRGAVPPDTSLYPIVFLFRHAVELSLKQLITDIFFVAGKTPPPKLARDLTREHGLAELWTVLKPELDAFIDTQPPGDVPSTEEFDELLSDLASFDPDGVPFRYPTTTKGEDCHPPLSIVDLGALGHGMSRAEALLRAWMNRLDEYVQYVQERRAERAGRPL